MLQTLFLPAEQYRFFNTRQLRRVSQLKAFTDSPPFVWMLWGCTPVFMISILSLPPVPGFQSSPLVSLASRDFKGDFLVLSALSQLPQRRLGQCVPSCYFHPVASLCHTLYCVSYKNTHSDSQRQSLAATKVQFYQLESSCCLWRVKKERGATGLQARCWHSGITLDIWSKSNQWMMVCYFPFVDVARSGSSKRK